MGGDAPNGAGERGRTRLMVAAGTLGLVLALASLLGGEASRGLAFVSLLLLALVALTAFRSLGDARRALARAGHDSRQLVELPGQASWICDPHGRFLFVSERWTEWTGLHAGSTRHDWSKAVHEEDRERVVSSWVKALAEGVPHELHFRLRTRSGEHHWMRSRAVPYRDAEGRIVRWIGQVEDVHDNYLAEQRQRQTAGLLEMIGTSTDSMMWAKDRDGRMLYINRALERMAGVTLAGVVGKTDAEWIPNSAEAAAFSLADQRVLETGSPDDREEIFTGADGVARHYRSLRSPLKDPSGAIVGSVGVATDITEQREAEERERLLTRELDHRAKNLLAVVQSVVTLTRANSLEEFKQAVEGRIQALGRAHSMLADSRWEGADLARIVEEELAPYAIDPSRVELDGPSLLLKPATAQSLALVIHELATNAAKYGALAAEGGRLSLSWRIDRSPGGAMELKLVWTERGGPRVTRRVTSGRGGFGTRLIHSSIERQLGGHLELDWAAEGLEARLFIPIGRSLVSPPPESGPDGEETPAPPRPSREPHAA
jgi:PAS domain S-box-containing protein